MPFSEYTGPVRPLKWISNRFSILQPRLHRSGKQLIGPGPRPFDSSIDVRREGLETVLFSYVTVRVTPEVSINIYGGTIEQMAALMSSLEEPL